MKSFWEKRFKRLEGTIRTKLDLQLNDWIENLQKEQTRIGEQVRDFAEDRLVR